MSACQGLKKKKKKLRPLIYMNWKTPRSLILPSCQQELTIIN